MAPVNTPPRVSQDFSFIFLLEISNKFISLFPSSEVQIDIAEGFVYEATCQIGSR